MKNDLIEWIDKEVVRLDREAEGENLDDPESNSVPDELREALAKASGKKPHG